MQPWSSSRVATLVAALLLSLLLPPTGALAAGLSVRLCHVAYGIPFSTGAMAHADFSTRHFAPLYPNISWSYHVVAFEGSNSIQRVTRAVLDSGQRSQCDVLLGPTTSTLSVGISSIVNLPWVSDTASSTELASKDTHPWFSRVIPTDADTGKAMAAMVRNFGWSSANVLCSEEPYGRSLASGFLEGMRTLGGGVGLVQCGVNSKEWALEALQEIQTQPSRIVIVSSSNNRPIVEAAEELGMNTTHVFIFGEVACTDTSPSAPIKALAGAFCIQYELNSTTTAPYLAAWGAHPPGMFSYLNEGYNLPLRPSEYDFSSFSALSSDMVRHTMHTLHGAFEASGFNESVFKVKQFWKRRRDIREGFTPNGLTGPIKMDTATGDRIGANVGFFNIRPNGTKLGFASWSNVTGVLAVETGEALHWMDGTQSMTPVVDVLPDPPVVPQDLTARKEVPTLLLVVVFVAVCTLVLLLVIVFKVRAASKEAIKRLLRSNLLFSLLKILAQVADCVTDGLAAYIVATRGGDSIVFVGFYIALAGLGIVVGLIDTALMLAHVFALLKANGELDGDVQVAWSSRLSRWGMVSLVVEDLPMGILAAVALSYEPSWLLIISLAASCGFVGAKFKRIPDVLRDLTQESIEDQIASDVMEFAAASFNSLRKEGSQRTATTAADLSPKAHSLNKEVSVGSVFNNIGGAADGERLIDIFSSVAPPLGSPTSSAGPAARSRLLQAHTAKMIEERFPARYEELLGTAESMVRQCRRRRIGGAEYSLVVAPRMEASLVADATAGGVAGAWLRSTLTNPLGHSAHQDSSIKLVPSTFSDGAAPQHAHQQEDDTNEWSHAALPPLLEAGEKEPRPAPAAGSPM